MNRILVSLLLAPCLVVMTGCAPRDNSEDNQTSTDMSQTISLSGDFDGPLGLQLWSVREAAADDAIATLKTVHDFGIREVETAGSYGLSIVAFRKQLDAAGLKATAMHAGYEQFRDSIDVVLSDAEALGAKYVGAAWIPHDGSVPFTNEMALAAAADFNRWGSRARDRGLTFFYHLHGYEFQPNADGTTPFDKLVAATDANNVKFEIDVFWVTHSGTDAADLMRKYPDRFALMHIKDMKKGTPTGIHTGGSTADTDVPVGTGLIDYRAVLAAAKEIGVSHYYIEDESTTPLTGIPESISFLETLKFDQPAM